MPEVYLEVRYCMLLFSRLTLPNTSELCPRSCNASLSPLLCSDFCPPSALSSEQSSKRYRAKVLLNFLFMLFNAGLALV